MARGRSTKRAATGVRGVLSTAVTAAVVIIAVILLAHIALALLGGNPDNTIVAHLGRWAHTLAWQFRDVFSTQNAKVATTVNYGLAVIVYVAVGLVLLRLLRRGQH